ncbi:nucleotidyltransferase family protein [Aequorivita sublithincola]|nr:nucleotidyltransferase domain-containing protein [Aequorivita sublithincola]
MCKSLRIKRMYMFGSMAKNTYTNDSDIDLLISFEDNISAEEYSENYFSLHHKLRELLKREIEIVTERSLSNPYFIKKVNNEKLLIYER